MNLHHLELFYYVARHGGISRAVRKMPYGIQQPAISSQILALEEDLSTKLFERQPFRLTPDGEEVYAFVRQFFDNVEEICGRVRKKHAPTIKIAASELILRDYLPAIILRMKESQPGLRFALRSGHQTEIEKWLEDREIDLAITPLDRTPASNLKHLPIVSLDLVLLVPRASGIKSAEQLWRQTPVAEPLIRLPVGEGITRAFDRGLKRLNVDWPVAIEASSTELVSQYVANGYGIGVTVNLPNLVKRRGVRVVPLPGFEPVQIAALWREPTTPLSDALRTVIADRARQLWPTAR
jgi:DNA-binding transcriptional LysR family regulator